MYTEININIINEFNNFKTNLIIIFAVLHLYCEPLRKLTYCSPTYSSKILYCILRCAASSVCAVKLFLL